MYLEKIAASPPRHRPPPCGPGLGPRILLAEHEARHRAVLQSLLTRVGYRVRTVESVPGLFAEARASMGAGSSTSFDVVVAANGLPGGDALRTLERLRGAGLHTPILLLAFRCPRTQRRVDRMDLAELIGRPVNVSLLERRVRAMGRAAK